MFARKKIDDKTALFPERDKLHLPINKYRAEDKYDQDGAQYHRQNSVSRESCWTLVI